MSKIIKIINNCSKTELQNWINDYFKLNQPKYSSHLYSESTNNALLVNTLSPTYDNDAKFVDGRIIIRENFDAIFSQYPEVLIFGEDAGKIGDVNQGLEGLQEKYGDLRISDTGIREATIIGQGIGMAMRGLRPIAEIQYLDYLMYALQIISDDLATLHYRTLGKQKAPMIIRTRGHRLEGIWHSGSQLGGILNLIRGVFVLVPRNMTVAAGFYNTMLESDQPALIIECLNGYRLKEKLPINLEEVSVPVGVPEIIQEGTDVTLITYGSCLRIAQEGIVMLQEKGISVELIDVQSILPFDIHHSLVESIKKTNRCVVLEESWPLASISSEIAYHLQRYAFDYLDAPVQRVTQTDTPFAFSPTLIDEALPNVERIVKAVAV